MGLDRADDADIWAYAREHDLVIVTKDTDFADLQAFYGSPPKVIWVHAPYASIGEVEVLFREHAPEITAFLDDALTGIMELS